MKANKDLRVLVVDDFATMRRVIRNLLVELGFTPKLMREAENGKDAMDVLDDTSIDLVILDWNMPETPGIETLRWVRAHETLAKVPVLMVTAEATREQIMEAAEIGVDGYILKPFTADTLKRKLDAIFKARES